MLKIEPTAKDNSGPTGMWVNSWADSSTSAKAMWSLLSQWSQWALTIWPSCWSRRFPWGMAWDLNTKVLPSNQKTSLTRPLKPVSLDMSWHVLTCLDMSWHVLTCLDMSRQLHFKKTNKDILTYYRRPSIKGNKGLKSDASPMKSEASTYWATQHRHQVAKRTKSVKSSENHLSWWHHNGTPTLPVWLSPEKIYVPLDQIPLWQNVRIKMWRSYIHIVDG